LFLAIVPQHKIVAAKVGNRLSVLVLRHHIHQDDMRSRLDHGLIRRGLRDRRPRQYQK
jgi:hypothetical protein